MGMVATVVVNSLGEQQANKGLEKEQGRPSLDGALKIHPNLSPVTLSVVFALLNVEVRVATSKAISNM